MLEGNNIDNIARQLERCAMDSLRWADRNAVRFEISKTEAVLLSRMQALAAEGRKGETSPSTLPGTLPGVWLDSAPLSERTDAAALTEKGRQSVRLSTT